MRFYKTIRFLLLFVASTLSMVAFSQEKAIHFGASFNAKITQMNIESEEYDDSQDKFSYAFAGNIYYNLGSKFQLVSGVSFSQFHINLVDYSLIFLCDISSNGVDIKNSYVMESYRTSYVGIPLEFRWEITGEANKLFLQLGAEGLYKIGLKETTTLFECKKVSQTPILRWEEYSFVGDFLFISKIGIGYEFQLGEKVKLFFEPNVEYSLNKFFKYESFNSNFFNVGLNTGVKF